MLYSLFFELSTTAHPINFTFDLDNAPAIVHLHKIQKQLSDTHKVVRFKFYQTKISDDYNSDNEDYDT